MCVGLKINQTEFGNKILNIVRFGKIINGYIKMKARWNATREWENVRVWVCNANLLWLDLPFGQAAFQFSMRDYWKSLKRSYACLHVFHLYVFVKISAFLHKVLICCFHFIHLSVYIYFIFIWAVAICLFIWRKKMLLSYQSLSNLWASLSVFFFLFWKKLLIINRFVLKLYFIREFMHEF